MPPEARAPAIAKARLPRAGAGRLPELLRGSRRGPFLRLTALGFLQGLGAFLIVHGFGRLAARPGWTEALILGAAAAAMGLLESLRTVEAERLGQAYVRQLRRRLLARLAGAGAPGMAGFGRGSLWLRLTGDLNGLRRWVSQGLSSVIVALPMVATLLTALGLSQPHLAAVAAAGLAVLGLLMLALRMRLNAAEERLRRSRARLANKVAASLDAIGSRATADPLLRAVRRRGVDVARESVARSRLHGVVRGSTEFALVCGAALAILLAAWQPPAAGAATVQALALFGLLTKPVRDLARAYEMRQSYRVAVTKARRILDLPLVLENAGIEATPH